MEIGDGFNQESERLIKGFHSERWLFKKSRMDCDQAIKFKSCADKIKSLLDKCGINYIDLGFKRYTKREIEGFKDKVKRKNGGYVYVSLPLLNECMGAAKPRVEDFKPAYSLFLPAKRMNLLIRMGEDLTLDPDGFVLDATDRSDYCNTLIVAPIGRLDKPTYISDKRFAIDLMYRGVDDINDMRRFIGLALEEIASFSGKWEPHPKILASIVKENGPWRGQGIDPVYTGPASN